MPIYSFGVDTDQGGGSDFSVVKPDLRSDDQQRHTPLAIHNTESNDLQLARQRANEIINVSGAEIKVYARTDNADYDKLWDADPDPTYWNPVFMKAYFKPQPLEVELKKWGAEASDNRTEIIFSHHQLYEKFSDRMLRVGDVIQIPYNAATKDLNPKYYRVTNAAPTGNYRYAWLYFTCHTTLLTADITVRPIDASPMPIDEPAQGYRESA